MKTVKAWMLGLGGAALAWGLGFYCGWHSGVFSKAIPASRAQTAVMSQLPEGSLVGAHFDRKDGWPAWEFDIEQDDPGVIKKVYVHALTGEVMETRLESSRKAIHQFDGLADRLKTTAETIAVTAAEKGLPDPVHPGTWSRP